MNELNESSIFNENQKLLWISIFTKIFIFEISTLENDVYVSLTWYQECLFFFIWICAVGTTDVIEILLKGHWSHFRKKFVFALILFEMC